MKQVLMLLLAARAFTTTFTQSRYDRVHRFNNDVISRDPSNPVLYGTNNRRYNNYTFNNRAQENHLQNINCSFDARIYEVKTDRWMRNAEKRRQVRLLEAKRTAAIRQEMDRYNNRRNDFDDRYARRGRY